VKRSLALFLLFLLGMEASAQDADTLEFQIDEALQINIGYRLLSPGEMPVFSEDPSQRTQIPTFAGNPVTIWLKGTNVIIHAVLTPYPSSGGKLLLLAQGQVWYSEPSVENEVKVLSSYKSIDLALGEKVFFYPLGVPDEMHNSELFNIALEIEITSYQDQNQDR